MKEQKALEEMTFEERYEYLLQKDKEELIKRGFSPEEAEEAVNAFS